MTLDELKPLIALEIRSRRQRAGLTQRAIAEKIGTSRAWVTMMENQDPPILLDTLLKVCDALDCTLADFFNSVYEFKELAESGTEEKVRQVVVDALDKHGFTAEVTVVLRPNLKKGG